VLIVTDCSDRLRGLKASIQTDEVEITGAASPDELSRACDHEHVLAVIDVGPDRLPEALRILRSSERHSKISVLVEASRIVSAPGLAGLLPKYRAMPCSRSDLLELARHLTTGEVHPRTKRMLL
jgi:hypothetical protein